MNSCTVLTGPAGMSCVARISSHSARGFSAKRCSMMGSSASLFRRRSIQEPKRGSSANSSMPSALQSFAQNDWLPQARKNHSPSLAW